MCLAPNGMNRKKNWEEQERGRKGRSGQDMSSLAVLYFVITTSPYRRQTDAPGVWEPSAEPEANFTLKPNFSCDL